MRKIIASTYVTLDGYIDNPHLWSLKFWSDDSAHYARDLLFASDALLLGRLTYVGFAQSWPSMSDEGGFAERMNSLPKYVVSTTLEKAEWNNSTIIRDNVPDEIAKLKQEPGQDILIYGCGRLTDTLLQHNLLDEYRIWVHPVVLGAGQPLFTPGTKANLELLDIKQLSSGVAVLTYRPVEATAVPGAA